jgi:hypothetical protein
MQQHMYTKEQDEYLLSLEYSTKESALEQGIKCSERWTSIYLKFVYRFPTYPSSWKALYNHATVLQRRAAKNKQAIITKLTNSQPEVATKASQQSEGDTPPEEQSEGDTPPEEVEMATPWLTCARAQGMRTCG